MLFDLCLLPQVRQDSYEHGLPLLAFSFFADSTVKIRVGCLFLRRGLPDSLPIAIAAATAAVNLHFGCTQEILKRHCKLVKWVQGRVKSRKGRIPKNSKWVITLFVFLHCLSPGLFGFCRIRILRSRRHCRIGAIGDFCLDDFSKFLRI